MRRILGNECDGSVTAAAAAGAWRRQWKPDELK
jgi:hypothetical protein